MDDWLSVDFSDSGEDSIFQLLDGGDADVFEKGSCHPAKQCFGDVEPRSMRGSENVPESVGVFAQIPAGLFGEMGGVVVQDDSDDAFRRIVRVQFPKQGNKFDAAMTRLDSCDHMSVEQIERCQYGERAKAFILVVP